jgi:hypothetical protein
MAPHSPVNVMTSSAPSFVVYPNGNSGTCVSRTKRTASKRSIRLSATRATVIALACTVSEVFDVPVYWPILVVYFLTLFVLTMRRQIQYVSLQFPSPSSRSLFIIRLFFHSADITVN